jgi:phage terminase large subunit
MSRLVEIVREHCDLIVDRETLEELLTIVRNEKGRIEAPEGGHDDMMMALAIAHEIRDQVVFTEEPINVAPHFNFESEKTRTIDYGDDMVVV